MGNWSWTMELVMDGELVMGSELEEAEELVEQWELIPKDLLTRLFSV